MKNTENQLTKEYVEVIAFISGRGKPMCEKFIAAEDTGWWTSRSTVLWRETAEQIGKRRRSTKKRKNTEEGKKKDRKEQERGKRS